MAKYWRLKHNFFGGLNVTFSVLNSKTQKIGILNPKRQYKCQFRHLKNNTLYENRTPRARFPNPAIFVVDWKFQMKYSTRGENMTAEVGPGRFLCCFVIMDCSGFPLTGYHFTA